MALDDTSHAVLEGHRHDPLTGLLPGIQLHCRVFLRNSEWFLCSAIFDDMPALSFQLPFRLPHDCAPISDVQSHLETREHGELAPSVTVEHFLAISSQFCGQHRSNLPLEMDRSRKQCGSVVYLGQTWARSPTTPDNGM